jgi:hypothetical protein
MESSLILRAEHIKLCEAEERHALLIGYNVQTAKEEVELVERFTDKYNFTSKTKLLGDEATSENVREFFATQ